jgi:hypothetical protein
MVMSGTEIADKIGQKIRQGIMKFREVYKVPANQVQIVFMLDEKNRVKFMTCIDKKPRNTVELSDLIGNGLENFFIKSHIKGLLKKFCNELNDKYRTTNLMAGIIGEDGQVFILLRKGDEVIRQISDADELS